MNTFVAIGSAHLDVIATGAGDPRGIDQPGATKIEVGGTACNVAINWARLGVKSRLLTTTDDSAVSHMILEHVKKQNVEVVSDKTEESGVGVFSAHLDQNGELVSAISHMPIETHHFSDIAFDDALYDAKYVLMDCNLSPEELSAASIECLARAIPFAVAGVSEEKSLRLNSIRSMPSLVSLNVQEASYFISKTLKKNLKDPIDKIVILSEHMRCPCLMTLGAQGAIYYDGKSAPIWKQPERIVAKGNRLGAGDGFLAAFINAMDALGENPNPEHALSRAMRIAAIMASREHANLGTAKPLETAFEELGAKAYQDPLTGLANRAGAHADLEKRRGSADMYPLSVLLLDIDHFKKVNDTLGHDQGDLAIKAVSSIAQSCLRSEDIASRWGGEEFVCFLPGTSPQEAYLIAERIRTTIEATEIIPNWTLTVSIGASLGLADEPLEAIIKKADEALYQSKNNGRNCVTQSQK